MVLGCSTGVNKPVDNPFYLASFSLDDSTTVEVLVSKQQDGLTIMNGVERVFLPCVSEGVYSVPVFGGALVGNWVGEGGGKSWVGEWIDSLRIEEYRVPLRITLMDGCGQNAVVMTKQGVMRSVWDTDLGRLKMDQQGDSITATFLTSTGDYRYQAGKINLKNSRFKIGNFDGVHLFSFEGTIKGDSIINGVFKSGIHYHSSWSGVRAISNDVGWSSAQAWNPESEIIIEGINSSGKTVVWTRDRLKNSGYKILVVDVMGTWCPNCMDECRLLKSLKEDYPEMVVVSMAFERSLGERALKRIADFKTDIGISWDVLLGGRANKGVADSTLSFMGGIKSFPTTAFIPIVGDLVIHSGFSGPATGESYEEEVAFFKKTIESLTQGSR
jgi:thiol-disulfide isomerase/thioredoxin